MGLLCVALRRDCDEKSPLNKRQERTGLGCKNADLLEVCAHISLINPVDVLAAVLPGIC